jgi:hypothetical protein
MKNNELKANVKQSVMICFEVPSQNYLLGKDSESQGNQMSLSPYVCCVVYKQNLHENFLLSTKDPYSTRIYIAN